VIAADGKAAAEAIAAGRTPLEHLLSVMNDPLADPVRRDEWARAAAPFVHPKLGTVEVRHLPSSMGRLPSPTSRSSLSIRNSARRRPTCSQTRGVAGDGDQDGRRDGDRRQIEA